MINFLFCILIMFAVTLPSFTENKSDAVKYVGNSYIPIENSVLHSIKSVDVENLKIKNELHLSFLRKMNEVDQLLKKGRPSSDDIKNNIRDLYFQSVELGLEVDLLNFMNKNESLFISSGVNSKVDNYHKRLSVRLGGRQHLNLLKEDLVRKKEGSS